MNDKNRKVCERFQEIMNSDFLKEILRNNNFSLKDVIRAQDNFNSKLMNFIYVYIKLVDFDEFLVEDINLFLQLANNEGNLEETISKIVVTRMVKNGLDYSLIRNCIVHELLDNRLYLHCTYEESAKKICGCSIDQLDFDLDKIISLFSLYGKSRLFEYVRFDDGLFYYAGNFDYASAYCYSSPEWLYILLGDAYVLRDKEVAFQKLNHYIEGFGLSDKSYISRSFDRVWNYYDKVSNKPNILFFEGEIVDSKDDIYFEWDIHKSEEDNLTELLSSLSYVNNRFTKSKVDTRFFERVELPALNEIVNDRESIIKR